MIRVLHVIDPRSSRTGPGAMRLISSVLARGGRSAHALVLVGGGIAPDAADLPALGAVSRGPRGWAVDGGLRRLLRGAAQRFDVVHAWGGEVAIRLARLRVTPLVASILCGPSAEEGRLGRAAASGALTLVAPSLALLRRCLGDCPEHDGALSLPPAVEPGAARGACRSGLRREWGAGDATLVVALIGQPVEWTDAMRGAIALGRAVKAGRRAMLVVHSRARSRAIAQNWARRLGLSRHLVIDDRVERPWRIASGLDACVATMSVGGAGEAGPWMPGDLPLAAAMAEGLPVMADPATWVPGLVEGGGAAGAAGPQPVDPLALQLMALCDVPGLRAALGTEAQRRARQARDPEAYRDRMDAIYGRCG